jgi:hypothetical protein
VTLRRKIVRKVKIMVVAVATTLLVASPAFAADNNGGIFGNEGVFGNGEDNGANNGNFFGNDFMNGGISND